MPFRVSTVETIDGIDRELNSLTIDHVGDYSLDFVPHGGTVNVVWTKAVSSPPTVTLTVLGLHFGHWTYEPGEVYVQLCNSRDPYEFGFNGKYKDNEIAGTGNSLDFGARMYNPRLARWNAVDPLAIKYPTLSPYNFVGNSPMVFIDPDGKKIYYVGMADVSSNFRAAVGLLTSTEEGRRLYNKYANSTTEDLYIGTASFSAPDMLSTRAQTFRNVTGESERNLFISNDGNTIMLNQSLFAEAGEQGAYKEFSTVLTALRYKTRKHPSI